MQLKHFQRRVAASFLGRALGLFLWPLFAVTLATVLRLSFDSFIGLRSPLLLHTLAVVLVAAYRGPKEALLAAVLGTLAVDFWFIEPVGDLIPAHPHDYIALGLFVVVNLTISVFAGRRASLLKQLQRAYERITLIHEAARIGTSEWLVKEDRVLWSPEMENLYGISSPDHVHTFEEWQTFVHPEDRAADMEALETAARLRLPACESTYRIVRKDGKVRWIHTRRKYSYDTDGEPFHILTVNMDVTDLHKAEQELRRSNEELQAFAYTLSHDLREPIRQVTTFSDLLVRGLDGSLSADCSAYLGYIRGGALRMNAMMDSLLTYSRLGSDKKPKELVNCNAVVQEAMGSLRLKIAESGATIAVRELPVVEAWPGRLEQVFQNLIQNAIKYRRADVPLEVHIEAEERDREWLFSVRDNGIGFEQQQSERIFMLFKQLHSRKEYDGMGMGLAIVKRIVERHGGAVCAEGRPGIGAKFYFTIPKPDGDRLNPLGTKTATAA